MKRIIKSLWKLLPLIVFLLTVLFSIYTAYCYPANFIDSDLSSDLVLGKLLANENKIITTDWFYSTEIRFLNTNLVYMPLFKLFQNWRAIRFAAILIFQALLLLSYYYLSRQICIGKNAFFLSASLMLLPMNVLYGRMILYQNYYSPYIILGFFIAGLYLSVLKHQGQSRLRQGLRIGLLLALSVISCLTGFRQLPFTLLPLLIVSLLIVFRDHWHKTRRLAGVPGEAKRAVLLAGCLCAAGLIGLLVHLLILPAYSSYRLLSGLSLQLASLEQIQYIAQSYLSVFGYQEGRMLFSMGGAVNIAGICAAALMIGLTIPVFIKKEPSLPRAVMGLMYPVTMLLTLCIFLFSKGSDNYPQYFIMAFIWIVPFLGLLLDWRGFSWRRITMKQALTILLCLCLLLSGVFHNRYFIRPEGKQVIYDPHTFVNPDYAHHQKGAVDFIEKSRYEIGYATFWQANSVTEATNGRVPMIIVKSGNPFWNMIYHDWLTDKRLRSRETVEGKNVFLLLTTKEQADYQYNPLVANAQLVYQDGYSAIYKITPSTALWDALGGQAEKNP